MNKTLKSSKVLKAVSYVLYIVGFIGLMISCSPEPISRQTVRVGNFEYDYLKFKDSKIGVEVDGKRVIYDKDGAYDTIYYAGLENVNDKPGVFIIRRKYDDTLKAVDVNGESLYPSDYDENGVKFVELYDFGQDRNGGEDEHTDWILLLTNSENRVSVLGSNKEFLFDEWFDDVKCNVNIVKDKLYSYIICEKDGLKSVRTVSGFIHSDWLNFDEVSLRLTEKGRVDGEAVSEDLRKPYFEIRKNGKKGVLELDNTLAVPVKYEEYKPVYSYKAGPINFYWKVTDYDGTTGLYYMGEEKIPTGYYDGLTLYNDHGMPWLLVELDDDDCMVRGAIDLEGRELVPMLKNVSITYNGDFNIFSYEDHEDEKRYGGYSWDQMRYWYTEKYSPSKHSKYRYKGRRLKKLKPTSNGQSKGSGSIQSTGTWDTYQEFVRCIDCNGSGRCRYCSGDGWDFVTNSRSEIISSQKCSVCNGSGTCQLCYGNGGHYENRIRVK